MVWHPSEWRTAGRLVELVCLFILTPVLLYLYRDILGIYIIPILLGAGLWCLYILLTDDSFDRELLWNAERFWPRVKTSMTTFLIGAIACTAGLWIAAPNMLFGLIREDVLVWVLAVLPYPLLSVYPQELIFRTFFFHRYDELLPSTSAKVVTSAGLFGLVHIVFGNAFAVIVTIGAGILFAHTYARTRSTLQAAIEHAFWGFLVFTVGLHPFFYVGEPEVLLRSILGL